MNASPRGYPSRNAVLDRLGADRYSSGELLNRTEASLDRGHLDDYLDMLFAKVESCHYPSVHLLDRIGRLAPYASS